MKKMLSLLLALLMLVLCTASAETAVQTQTLLSPDGSYSFDVPADYFPMNTETMKALFTTDEMKAALAEVFSLEDASQLEPYLAMIAASNMIFVYSGDMRSSLNVQITTATMTMEMMAQYKSLLDASIVQQYMALGAAEEDITLMDVQEVGGYQWYAVQVVLSGMRVSTRMTIVDGLQYTISFSDEDDDVVQLVLGSFQVNAAEEEPQIISSPNADALASLLDAADLQTLVSPNGDYQFDVPADFIPMNSDAVKAVFDTDEMRQYVVELLGLEDASQLEVYFDTIQASNMMLVFDDELYANLNIQANQSDLTMEQIVQLKDAMDAAIIQQYAALGIQEENITLMDIQTIGAYQWYGVQMMFSGIPMQTMITVVNGIQYTFTFTALEDAVVQTVLESFIVNAAE